MVDGEPLDRGSIHFVPDYDSRDQRHLYFSSADIQEDGNYSLDTYGRPGAPLGEYRVLVCATATPPPTDQRGWGPDWIVHEKYTKRVTTDLRIEVVESPADNDYDVQLER